MNKQKLFEELLKKKGIHGPRGAMLVRRDAPGPYQLSFAQRRIWFLQQFDKESAAYNDPTALRIKGPLNISLMEQTFNEIIRRHQVLRMTFPAHQGQPVQVPHNNESITIYITLLHEWSGYHPGKTPDEQIREFVNQYSGQPFDLSKDMLFRATLLIIKEEDYALVVNIHHIVMDGWSKGIMLQELMDLYQAFSGGKPSPLEELSIQYTDYISWHHEWVQGKLFQSQLSYWKEKLADTPPILELPTDHPRSNIPGSGGSLEPFSFSRQKYQALNDLAKQEDVTLFMLMMTAYNTLLYRYSRQEDILVGTPIAGRNRVELENLIGLFVNTLVIRSQVSGNPSFKTLLRRVRATALEAYSNQDIPFEKLVEELNPQRSLSVAPLFQVMFQLQNAPMPPAHISGLAITPIQIDTGFFLVDLSLTLWEEQDIMRGTFEYNTDLFETTTIKRIINHFQVLLDGVLADIEQKITHLPMMSREEMHQILVEWNDTDAEYPKDLCIYQLFDVCTEKHGEQEAVIFANGSMSYAHLNREANRLAHVLQSRKVGPETLVGICMENSFELITGVLGILKVGGAYIPMDPQYPDERLKLILKDAQPTVLFTSKSLANRFKYYDGAILCLNTETSLNANKNTGICRNDSKPENAACVIYTSGSTGEPKGTLMNNRNIINLIYSFMKSYKPGPGDNILPLTSIASASFVGEIIPILTAGGGIVLAEKEQVLDMKKLTALFSTYQVTILSTVPSMIARLNALQWNPGKLRLVLSGGEALSAGDIDRLPGSITIVNGYGLTEATICSTYIIVNEYQFNFSTNPVISIGKPIINTQVYILDQHRNPVPIGVPGEIYIGGDGLSRGYLNNPELTNEKLLRGGLKNEVRKGRRIEVEKVRSSKMRLKASIPWKSSNSHELYNTRHFDAYTADTVHLKKPSVGPKGLIGPPCQGAPGRRRQNLFQTGDLGAWQPDGTIKFLGRIDTQVQIHGYRIELSEVENHLGLHPDIRDVIVIDREVVPGDRRLVAYIVAAEENGVKHIPPNINQLRDWLSKRIPDYMIPGVFETIESIPLTVNGKVNIEALPLPSWERPGLGISYKAPQTRTEQAIAATWQEFLRLDKVGINDNFFDLGGHSLLLTRVHSRLSEIVGQQKELTIVDLFRYPTIYSLAKYIDEDKKKQFNDTHRQIRFRAAKQRQVFSRKPFNRKTVK